MLFSMELMGALLIFWKEYGHETIYGHLAGCSWSNLRCILLIGDTGVGKSAILSRCNHVSRNLATIGELCATDDGWRDYLHSLVPRRSSRNELCHVKLWTLNVTLRSKVNLCQHGSTDSTLLSWSHEARGPSSLQRSYCFWILSHQC